MRQYKNLGYVLGFMIILFITILSHGMLAIKETEPTHFTITELYTDSDGHSKFREIKVETSIMQKLGYYSENQKVNTLSFRHSRVGDAYDYHLAPRKQYIVYLSGEAVIETSDGEKKYFKSGDILLASDTTGRGHKTTITKNGQALVIEVE